MTDRMTDRMSDRMSACLICGCPQSTAIFHGSDRLYHTTTKQFSVVRCDQCGLLRLDPTPSPEELARYYPDNYWFAPDKSTASRMEEAYRRLVLRDHVQFVAQALAAGDFAALRLIPRMLAKRAQIRRIRRLTPAQVRRLLLDHRLRLSEVA